MFGVHYKKSQNKVINFCCKFRLSVGVCRNAPSVAKINFENRLKWHQFSDHETPENVLL